MICHAKEVVRFYQVNLIDDKRFLEKQNYNFVKKIIKSYTQKPVDRKT